MKWVERTLERLRQVPGVGFVLAVAEVYFDRRVSRSAASLAYFLILSFFPLLICVNAFVGLLRLDVDLVLEAAGNVLPQESLPILGEYLGYINTNPSRAMLLAGISMVLFSASAAFRTLMGVMADLYRRPTYRGMGQVAASILFSVLFLVTVYLSILVVLTGGWFLQVVEGRFVWVDELLGNWQDLRFLVLFCLVLLFVLLTYRLSLPRGGTRPPILPGAVLASAALVAFSVLFSWFIGLSSRYSLVYGSLASVIILLVWLYLCGNILIVGNVFNYVWSCRRGEEKRTP